MYIHTYIQYLYINIHMQSNVVGADTFDGAKQQYCNEAEFWIPDF